MVRATMSCVPFLTSCVRFSYSELVVQSKHIREFFQRNFLWKKFSRGHPQGSSKGAIMTIFELIQQFRNGLPNGSKGQDSLICVANALERYFTQLGQAQSTRDIARAALTITESKIKALTNAKGFVSGDYQPMHPLWPTSPTNTRIPSTRSSRNTSIPAPGRFPVWTSIRSPASTPSTRAASKPPPC